MNRSHLHTSLGAAILVLALAAAGCASGSSDSAASGLGLAAAAEVATGATPVASSGSSAPDGLQAVVAENQESHATATDLDYDQSSVVEIALLGDSASSDSADVTMDDSTVTITTEGVYSLGGTLTGGGVVVAAADTDDVTLLLNGVDITNTDGAAIAVTGAEEVVIVLGDNTTNRLADGANYNFADADTDEPNATLFSAADLTIAGGGELIVDANYNDGISSKDGLVIESGTISVDAVDDGIRGKDYVIVNGGDIDVVAGGDGIKSDNAEDPERGYVLIADGVVDVTSGDDGVQAATDALIAGGTLTIAAGTAGSTEESGRAIQGDVMVVVGGGTVIADAVDDAIHSNDTVIIDGGDLTLSSGDDGIHGDFVVTINGGSVVITDSFEGIESEVITINDGFIDVTAIDDGLNVADGTAAETNTLAVGPGSETAGEYYIYINGGTTVVTIDSSSAADGDGLDSNGHLIMTGGVVVVSGPTDTRNSAFDANGSFEVTGGLLIGTNINGRNSEGVGDGSTVASLYLTSATVLDAGTVVHVQTLDGEGLVTFVPDNEFDVIVFASDALVAGSEYEVYVGGSVTGDSTSGLYGDSVYTQGELAGTATADG